MDPIIGQDGQAAQGLIKDGNTETFMEDVVEASKTTPVIVDFWADWCEPCKQLTPALEKAVNEAGGTVKLVKIDTEENKDLAAQLRVQSLPTVLAFKDGQPVDGFAGALPESEIKKFIKKLEGNSQSPQIDDFIEKGHQLLEQGDATQAIELFGQIVEAAPDNLDAKGGLAQAFLKAGQPEKAKEILNAVPEKDRDHAAIAAAKSALEFEENKPDNAKLEKLEKKVKANPKDNQAAYDLAEGLFAAGEKEKAAEALFKIIERDKKWNDEAARKLLVKMFEAAGPTDPFTVSARRRLSSILFS